MSEPKTPLKGFEKVPPLVWKLLKLPARIPYALGLGKLQGRFVLLLTTVGRKTGKSRVTPLQYEEVDGDFCVASARGLKADWVQNILANPEVVVRVKNVRFRGRAEVIVETDRVADFLELRLSRHPKMVGTMMRAEGLPSKPTRVQLESYAAKRVMIIIHPIGPKN